jgi:hypothetical protein
MFAPIMVQSFMKMKGCTYTNNRSSFGSMCLPLVWVAAAVLAVGILLGQSWIEAACWDSVFWSRSHALGVGIRAARLPDWQAFAQGSWGH